MTIHLTAEQWAAVLQETAGPVHVVAPQSNTEFVLVRSEVYERFQALFEDVPVTAEERRFHLQQFGKRAGWDDPAMDIYDELDPRRKT